MFRRKKRSIPTLSMAIAQQKLENNPEILLLDVRTPAEYRQGHLPGAKNVPLEQLRQRIPRFLPREDPIFLYCRAGHRSAQACEILMEAGYRNGINIGAVTDYSGTLQTSDPPEGRL